VLDITKDIPSLTTFRRRSGDSMKQRNRSKRPVVLRRYNGMRAAQAYELRLPGGWPPAAISVNGERIARKEMQRSQRLFALRIATPVTVSVKIELAPRSALLEDFAGKITRLREPTTF